MVGREAELFRSEGDSGVRDAGKFLDALLHFGSAVGAAQVFQEENGFFL